MFRHFGVPAHSKHHCQRRDSNDKHPYDEEALLVGDFIRREEHACHHGACISTRADNSRHCTHSPLVNEGHNSVSGAIGHLEKKSKDQHCHDRPYENVHGSKEHDSESFKQKKDSQYREPSSKAILVAGLVAEDASQSTREQIHHTEETGDDPGFLQSQLEVIHKVERGNVVDGDLYSETCAIGQEQYPDPVIPAGTKETGLLLRVFLCILWLLFFY